MDDWNLDDEELARLFGVTRLVMGTLTIVAPSFVSKMWLGEGAEDSPSRVGMRGLGGREAAIGLGTLLALERGKPVRGWLEAGALADAADAFGVIAQRKRLPALRVLLAAGIPVCSAWFCSQLASSFED